MERVQIERFRRHWELSSLLAELDDDALQAQFDSSETRWGWGVNHVLDIGGHPVFVKRIPLTERERAHPFSTRNLYGLPTFYNYGVGSAGFGAYRELVANIHATNWARAGEADGFPLLHHYRIRTKREGLSPFDLARHRRTLDYWGGHPAIGNYLADRWAARDELVLFLEHFPVNAHDWLTEHPDQTESFVEDLRDTCDFLWGKGMVHFDAHLHNVVTDGTHAYLTDFGLALDRSFDLSSAEQDFLARHEHYDVAEVIACLGFGLQSAFKALAPERQSAIIERFSLRPEEPLQGLLEHFEALRDADDLSLEPGYATCLLRHRRTLVAMRNFFDELIANPRKDTPFPSRAIGEALAEDAASAQAG